MCTPLSHAGAAFFVPVLLLGGSLVVVPYFEPGLVLKTIEEERITATMLVPTMLYMLLDHPDFATRDLSSLETVYYGAAAMSPTRLKEAIDRLGLDLLPVLRPGRGADDHLRAAQGRARHDDLARLATCGRPVPWVHVKLLDDDLNEVPRGEPGEICVRGPLVMQGYWNKPEQTAEALAGGWLHTGDIAREDEDGFYTIVDRKKDMIVTGGFNVFPREVEDVISSHPAVANVAVIGVPDERWGEAVKAVVVLRPDVSTETSALGRRAHRAGQGGQGLDPGAEVGRLRRRDPAQPARQARQEGPPPAVLDGHRPPGQLTTGGQPNTTSPAMIVATDVARRRVFEHLRQRAVEHDQVGGGTHRHPARRAAGCLGRGQEQGQRPLGRHRLADPEGLATGGPPLDRRGHVAPRIGVAVGRVGAAAHGDARLDQAAARVQVRQVVGVDLDQVAVAALVRRTRAASPRPGPGTPRSTAGRAGRPTRARCGRPGGCRRPPRRRGPAPGPRASRSGPPPLGRRRGPPASTGRGRPATAARSRPPPASPVRWRAAPASRPRPARGPPVTVTCWGSEPSAAAAAMGARSSRRPTGVRSVTPMTP